MNKIRKIYQICLYVGNIGIIGNRYYNVRCAHSEGQDPTGSDQPSRLCLNLNLPQPQPVQLSRLGLNSTQPALLVQPGPQPIQLVEVKVEVVK